MIPKLPKVVILPLTYRCNAKCIMCNIWQEKGSQEISLKRLESLFSENILADNIESINITGGEPLLRKELVDIIRLVATKCKKLVTLTINTNGFFYKKYPNLLSEIQKIQKETKKFQVMFYISLDGPREIHDLIRGKKGFFDNTLKTIQFLKQQTEITNLDVSVNCTITPENYQTMQETYELAADLGVKIDFTYSMESAVYFNNNEEISTMSYSKEAKEQITTTIAALLASEKLTYNRSYYRNLLRMIHGKKRVISCVFKEEGFFLHPSGKVYNCWAYDQQIGNIYDATLTTIWHSSQAETVRKEIDKTCETCTNNCYVNFKRNDSIKKLLESR